MNSHVCEVGEYTDERHDASHPPPPLTGIARVTTLKILGVTFTNSLSVAEHVHAVISSSAQTVCSQSLARPRHG